MQLALCAVAVWGGAAAAFYLYRTIHWTAGVVIVVYLWILLMDACTAPGRQSITWHLLDFLHHLLSFAGTALIVSCLWSIDWRIGAVALLPVFILLLIVTGFVLLRLYGLTPDGRADWKAREQVNESHEMPDSLNHH